MFLSDSEWKPSQPSTDYHSTTKQKDSELHNFQSLASQLVQASWLINCCCKSTPMSSSSGSKVKSVLRKKSSFFTFSSKQLSEIDTAFLASDVQCWLHQNGRKSTWGVVLTQSTEVLEELFTWCILNVSILLFLIKMLKSELCSSLHLGLIKASFTKEHLKCYLFLEHINNTICAKCQMVEEPGIDLVALTEERKILMNWPQLPGGGFFYI